MVAGANDGRVLGLAAARGPQRPAGGRVARDELASPQSSATRDALASGDGRIESEVLPLSYRHLSPLLNLDRPLVQWVEEGEHVGEHTLARPQPRRVERDDDDPAGYAGERRPFVNTH